MILNEIARQKIEDLDFDILNSVFEKYKDYYCICDEIQELAKIILCESPNTFLETALNTENKLKKDAIIDILLAFLESFDYHFLELFPTALSCIDFEGNGNVVKTNGQCYISLSNNIFDAFKIIHEVVHLFSVLNHKHNSVVRNVYAEIPSITVEFILYDYLKNLDEKSSYKYSVDDLDKWVRWRFCMSYFSAIGVFVEYELVKLYRQNGNKIDGEILCRYFLTLNCSENLEKILQNYFLPVVKRIIKIGKLSYGSSFRYVIGILYSCDLIKKDFKVESIFEIVQLLGKTNETLLNDIFELQNLGITLFKVDSTGKIRLTLTDDEKEELTRNYKYVHNAFFGPEGKVKINIDNANIEL